MQNNRRDFLKFSGIAGIGLLSSGFTQSQPAKVDSQPTGVLTYEDDSTIEPLNRFPRMVHDYFLGKVRNIEENGIKERSALKSPKDAEDYITEVRNKIQQCFGPWPEKTPLNARVTGILERDKYTVEKIIFESRPNFFVTANLYIPIGRKFPLPAVLGTCGHTVDGKASPVYQSFSQGLALKGYVVLIFDPIGQGERIQYLTSDLKSRLGAGTREHVHTGNQQFVVGESASSWFAWDGIRAIDYLFTRPEVDQTHIGVTGNSGGGMETTWLAGVDSRITMAAPSCFVTTLRRNFENEEVADTEQCPREILDLGLDHSDFIAAMSPNPVILLSQEKDFFDTRGTMEAYTRLKHIYKLLGAEENIQLFVGPGYHGYSLENREAMYGWFNKVTNISDDDKEPILTIEKEETLWCTPQGQVGALGSRTVFSFTKELAKSLKLKRGNLSGEALKQAVKEALKLPSYDGIPDYRILRPKNNLQYPKKFVGTYAVETERNILSLVYRLSEDDLYSRPIGSKRALLYVSHWSADGELRNEPLLTELIQNDPDSSVYACDVRGIGESLPNTTRNDFLFPFGSDYFYAIYSVMLNYPYVGQKTYDVLRLINWLKSLGHEEIHLVGKGWGAIPSTFAALLSESVNQVTLKNTLLSYDDIANEEMYSCPLSAIVPGVLKTFDLPDCYTALAKKNLQITGSWNADNA